MEEGNVVVNGERIRAREKGKWGYNREEKV